MLQAIGSSSAIAVGAGSVGDISTPAERGGYMGIYSMGSFLGPLLGPVLGLWIFWVLVIMVTPLWLVQIFLLPETLRSLVGNGSIYANPTPFQAWRHYQKNKVPQTENATCTATQLNNEHAEKENKSQSHNEAGGIPCHEHSFYSAKTECCNHSEDNVVICTEDPAALQPKASSSSSNLHVSNKAHCTKKRQFKIPNPFQSLIYLKEKDIAILLLYNSLQYAGLYSVLTSLTEIFTSTYGLDEFQVGLCFLSNGFGASIGSFTAGRLLNWKFKKVAQALNLDEKYTKRGNLDPEFPIENARMGFTWIWGIVFNIAMIAYGWSLFYKVHLAIPIIINFISTLSIRALSYVSTSTFTSTNTLLVDLFPKNSAAIIASNNLTRCFLAAAVVMIVQPGIQAIGVGWLFTVISLVLLVSRITIVVLFRCGPKWRKERLARQQQKG
ncbi:hypothetical protein [Parasitella parasitica]|uniref:Major facilitator superfamily (MFS) profile domain-containing protein n=1 Tax=Parasitella parasitica TaxID=35722 RepID=A0A0B7NA44_9FUNG|nr:hypothetical protein [Parasitella parasitica]